MSSRPIHVPPSPPKRASSPLILQQWSNASLSTIDSFENAACSGPSRLNVERGDVAGVCYAGPNQDRLVHWTGLRVICTHLWISPCLSPAIFHRDVRVTVIRIQGRRGKGVIRVRLLRIIHGTGGRNLKFSTRVGNRGVARVLGRA